MELLNEYYTPLQLASEFKKTVRTINRWDKATNQFSQFEFSTEQLMRGTGIRTRTTLAKLRKELKTARLIREERTPGGSIVRFIMLDEDGAPIPPKGYQVAR